MIPEPVVEALARDVRGLSFILVVDDNQDDRIWLANGLRSKQFSVIASASGEEAVAICGSAAPGGIVMDCRLAPGRLTGAQTVEAIRTQHGQQTGFNVAYVTGHVQDSPPPLAFAEGDRVFRKEELQISFAPLEDMLFGSIKKQAAEIATERLDPIVDWFASQVEWYRKMTGVLPPAETAPVKLLSRYRGVVAETLVAGHPDAAYVDLAIEGLTIRRLIPIEQLTAAGAFDADTPIEYSVYSAGNVVLCQVVRVEEAPMSWPTLSERAIRVFSRDDWHRLR